MNPQPLAHPIARLTDRLLHLSGSLHLDLRQLRAQIMDTRIQATSLGQLRSEVSAAIYTNLHLRNPRIHEQPTTGYQDLAAELAALIPHGEVWHPVTEYGPNPDATVAGTPHHRVVLDGVKVLAPGHRFRHDPQSGQAAVLLPSWRGRTTPGFLLAKGPSGDPAPRNLTRLYLACDSPDEAVHLWPRVLRMLNDLHLPYQAKVLSASTAYPRSDALVIYLSSERLAGIVPPLLEVAGRLPVPACEPSIFSEPLGGRVALAPEPDDPRISHRGLSFGQHRSRLLADALIAAAERGLPLDQAWRDQEQAAGIHPNS